MGRVVAIVNQKGGVGKTTTAVNLAASLAAAERNTLLIDCDPQGNATSGLGVALDPREPNLYHMLIGQVTAEDAILSTRLEHLHLVGADSDLAGAEVELAELEQRESMLLTRLRPLMPRYDYILLDCPPALGQLTVNALTCCHGVLIPLQCEYYALEGLARLLTTVRTVRQYYNPALVIEGILLTMYDGRNNLARQVVDDVRDHFKDLVFETVIPRNVRLSEAPSHGLPALLYDVKSAGAQAYLSMTQEFMAGPRPNGEEVAA